MGTYTKPLYGKTVQKGIHQVVSAVYDKDSNKQLGVQIKYWNILSQNSDGKPELFDSLDQCMQAYNNLKNKL
jgi:hypothetical protein